MTNAASQRSKRIAALLALAIVASAAPAQQSTTKTSSKAQSTKVVQKAGASVTNSARYETIRISKPDGSVVTLRVPRRHPISRIAKPATYQSATRHHRVGNPLAKSESLTEIPLPRLHNPDGITISHPTLGRYPLTIDDNLANSLRLGTTPARLGDDPAVAGDDATEWRTSRGWAPGGEGDDSGDYIGPDANALIPLVAGTEFTGNTPDPTPQGDPDADGYDAEVIARWDVVPYQTIAGNFTVGILAFHMNGIDRVKISIEGGPWTTLDTMRDNPRTGVREYVAEIRGDDIMLAADEEIELRAIAYPAGAGTPRLLESLFLYVNNQGSLTGPALYVASSGDDSDGDGSAVSPYATIRKALNVCNSDIDAHEGATIILAEPGRYDIDQPSQPVLNERWITVKSGESLSRDDVIIAAGTTTDLVRPNTHRLRFHRVSLDFSDMYQMYKEDIHQQWFDDSRWYYSQGWTYTPPASLSPVRNVGYGGLFVTDCLATDMLYGFITCNLVRGSHAEKISGDVYQNSLMVVQSSVNNVNGTILNHHSDISQYFGHFENVIVYNLNASLVTDTQNIFLDHANSSFTNCAFVNFAVQNVPSEPPFSQLNSAHDHVLFYHITNPGQRFVMRDDGTGSKKFTARNVIFRNSVVERVQAAGYFEPLPVGVTIDHCHFNYDDPKGINPTVGPIFLLNSSGGMFEYIGNGANEIVNSAIFIPGYSVSDTPDRGAAPWGQPR